MASNIKKFKNANLEATFFDSVGNFAYILSNTSNQQLFFYNEKTNEIEKYKLENINKPVLHY